MTYWHHARGRWSGGGTGSITGAGMSGSVIGGVCGSGKGGISGWSGKGGVGSGAGGPGGFTGSGVGAGISPGPAMPVQAKVDGAYSAAAARRATWMSAARTANRQVMQSIPPRLAQGQCAAVLAGAGADGDVLEAGGNVELLGDIVGGGGVAAGVVVLAGEAGVAAPGCAFWSLSLWPVQPAVASKAMLRMVLA